MPAGIPVDDRPGETRDIERYAHWRLASRLVDERPLLPAGASIRTTWRRRCARRALGRRLRELCREAAPDQDDERVRRFVAAAKEAE